MKKVIKKIPVFGEFLTTTLFSSSIASWIFGIWTTMWAGEQASELTDAVKGKTDKYFTDMASENPAIMVFFNGGIIIFITVLVIMTFYKIVGLKIGKRLRIMVLMSPLFIAISAVVYLGYIHNLRMNDSAYVNFKNVKNRDEYIVEKFKTSYSHAEEYKLNKDYVHDQIGKNLPIFFYDDMCKELPIAALNRMKKHTFHGDTYRNYVKYENIEISPLQYAAYLGNTEAVRSLLKSEKVDPQFTIRVKAKLSCPKTRLGKKYEYRDDITAYDLAYWNNNRKTASSIKEYCEAKGMNHQGRYHSNKSDICWKDIFGGSYREDRGSH